jgi:spermidine synthase
MPSGRTVLERVRTPVGEWQLQRRDDHYEIICNGVFLMASYNVASDRRLATLALARLAGDGLRILVGGLGIGFTAQAVLQDTRVATLEVVEIEPVIIAWHQRHLAALCGRPLDDPRTALVQGDLAHVALAGEAYDAILLDTDNGPDWLIREANARLYTPEAARRFLDALSPGGVLAYWSASPASGLAEVLAGLEASVQVVETEDQIAPGHPGTAWLYFAVKASTTRRVPPVGALQPPI